MKKTLFGQLFLVLMLTACFSGGTEQEFNPGDAPKRAEWKEWFLLYGDVDSVIITKANGKTDIYRFNEDGDVVQHGGYLIEYHPNGKTKSMKFGSDGFRLEYDTKGILMESFDDGGYDYEYDGEGRIVKKSSKTSEFWKTYTYNSAGLLAETSFRDCPGSPVWHTFKTVYAYDDNGNEVEAATYSNGGKTLDLLVEKKYDANDNLLEEKETHYGSWEGLVRINSYKYDDEGNKIEHTFYTTLGEETRVARYDSYGRETSVTKYNDGVMVYSFVNNYDEYGSLVEVIKNYSEEGKSDTTRYEVEYDTYGNPTSRIELLKVEKNSKTYIPLETIRVVYR